MLAGVSLSQEKDPAPDKISYQVRIEGVSSLMLRNELERHAQTVLSRHHPPASLRQLRHRARGDIPRLETVLQSRGYYEGQITEEILSDRSPVRVVFRVVIGPQYHIRRWVLTYADVNDPNHSPPALTVGAVEHRAADTAQILQTEQDLLSQLRNQGYPFCKIGTRDVVVHAEDQTLSLATQILPGPRSTFGAIHIKGIEAVDELYVRRRARWQAGDLYQEKRLRNLEKDLLEEGLFAAARVAPAEAIDPNGALPIDVTVSERKHRTLRVGGTYVSDEQGFGGQVSWEHRNLAGGGQRLRTQFETSQTEWRQSLGFVQPDLGHPDLDLLLNFDMGRKYPQAYWSENIRTGAILQYRFTRQSRLWGGLEYEASRVEQFGVRKRYLFMELPLGLDLDRRNDPLNAVKGWRFLIQSTPYWDTQSDLSFFRNYAEGRVYQRVLPSVNTVFAARLGAGLIAGTSLIDIPADKRFYAGGAGSVRGYAYQSIGPSANGTPLGGLSLVETSLELRTQMSRKFGTVVFLDGGLVMTDQFQRGHEEPMRWGAGVGMRYSLGFAPLRFDVAFPLNGDDNDREYQFYVSLGQAF
jgi:translocation and assembly module TamA